MRTPLPNIRTINALTGERAPDVFFQSLRDADERLADDRGLDTLREENASLRCELDEVRAERDDLAEKLRELDDSHQITLGLLSQARRETEMARRGEWSAL
jgi:predicted  nucleic acid-binding Zn-ribbon protein